VLVQKQRILCITRTVEHNYILPSSSVGIQHVSALYVGHLQVEIQHTDQLYKTCGVFFFRVLGIGCGGKRGETRSRCFNSGYHGLGLLQWIFSWVVYINN